MPSNVPSPGRLVYTCPSNSKSPTPSQTRTVPWLCVISKNMRRTTRPARIAATSSGGAAINTLHHFDCGADCNSAKAVAKFLSREAARSVQPLDASQWFDASQDQDQELSPEQGTPVQ